MSAAEIPGDWLRIVEVRFSREFSTAIWGPRHGVRVIRLGPSTLGKDRDHTLDGNGQRPEHGHRERTALVRKPHGLEETPRTGGGHILSTRKAGADCAKAVRNIRHAPAL